MEINISGLNCDNCNYKDPTIKFEQYKEYIGEKCPICEHSLLTQEDYDKCVRLYSCVEKINKVENILKWFNPFHYLRLFFGDKRKMSTITYDFKKKELEVKK